MRAMSMLFGATALLGAGLGLPERAVAESLFDPPLKIRQVRLKADPLSPQAKRVVSCFTYGYQAAKEEMAKMRCDAQSAKDRACVDKELKHINEQKWDDAPTAIAYEVEVSLGGASPVIKPLSDALVCRPSD